MTSWPHWRKDQFNRAVEALIEAQLITDRAIALPGDAGFRERFAAAFILFANAKALPREGLFAAESTGIRSCLRSLNCHYPLTIPHLVLAGSSLNQRA